MQEASQRSGDSYRDKHIQAVFALVPAIGGRFTKAGLSRAKIPVRIVVHAADAVTPSAENAQRYADGIQTVDFDSPNQD